MPGFEDEDDDEDENEASDECLECCALGNCAGPMDAIGRKNR
jgi:hypothetical protein